MFTSWFGRTAWRRMRGAAKGSRRQKWANAPWLEVLEDRCVPATALVNSISDDPNVVGTLRNAINNTSVDHIDFQLPAGSTITLNSANDPLAINRNLTIDGPGAANLKIDGGHTTGDTDVTVFSIGSGATVAIAGLTIADGYCTVWSAGGGVTNNGNLTVTNCTLSDNTNTSGWTGGIFNNERSSLTVKNSTVSNNSGDGIFTRGGGGSLAVTNCTFTGNPRYGININGGGSTIKNSRISDNFGRGPPHEWWTPS